jgi:LuxR family maltose regulon positive regulatory protein
MVALSELAKLHGRHGRADACSHAVERFRAFYEAHSTSLPSSIRGVFEIHLRLVSAGAILVAWGMNVDEASDHCRKAFELATKMKRITECVESRFLLAELKSRSNHPSDTNELNEAYSLAKAHGMIRRIQDHKSLSRLRPSSYYDESTQDSKHEQKAEIETVTVINDSVLLTPKEREVLLLLSKNLSNKEIAAAMYIGVETVKWHIKNLTGKLHAGNRKHAVARAKMLGLFSN